MTKPKDFKNVKIVMFDLDGTLVDAYPAIIESFNFTMKKAAAPKQNDIIIRRAVGWGDGNLIKPFIGKYNLKKALNVYRKHHKNALKRKTCFLPGAKHLLSYLKKKGYVLGLASNRPQKFTQIILKHLNMLKYFDCVLCGDMIKRAKPYPDILKKILKDFSLKPSQAVYIGDMSIDVIAGNRARVKTIAIATGSSTKKELKQFKPNLMIKSLSVLEKIL